MQSRQSQAQDAVGLIVRVYPQYVVLRNNTREKIFEYLERKPSPAIWRRRLLDLARRLEEILFREYPTKREYYNMVKGPIEPHLQFAIKRLSVQNRQRQQNRQVTGHITCSPRNGTMMTPGITQDTSENSRMSYVIGNTGPLSSGAQMVSQNANMDTLLPGEPPNEHVNTLLSLGISPTNHDRSRVWNNNLVIDILDTPATNKLQKSGAQVKEVPKGPKFSCPVCMHELADASLTICDTSSARSASRPPSRLRTSARPVIGCLPLRVFTVSTSLMRD